ncbi:hypothetical protein BG004_001821 [Podila humilis]|nr:hypothetical protein BG004_001821 [Podila humilis]
MASQASLQEHISKLSSELTLSQSELDKVQDTFAKVPHYVAKVTAMRNSLTSMQALARKVKRRTELVVIGREKQANKQHAARAKEKAYDQSIAAIKVPSPATTATIGTPTSQVDYYPTKDMLSTSSSSTSDRPSTPNSIHSIGKSIVATVASSLQATASSSKSAVNLNLPFPLPAKPAFPVVSTRSPNGSPPPGLTQKLSPLLSRQSTVRESSASPTGRNSMSDDVSIRSSSGSVILPVVDADEPAMEGRVDRFPEISAIDEGTSTNVGAEVEVVRVVRRKKKTPSRSSTCSTATLK